MQQLAWIHRSVQNELEAKSRSGQTNHSLLLFNCGFYPEWSPQLKKDKGMPSFRHVLTQSSNIDFIAHNYNNDDDCDVLYVCNFVPDS